MINKKGSLEGALYIAGGLAILLIVGVIFAIGSGVLSWVFTTATPSFIGLDQNISGWNASQTSSMVLNPLNSLVSSMSWMGGVLYVIGLLAIFGLAYAFRISNQRWIVPLFFCMMILIVMASIFISNIYQDIYTGTDEMALLLQAQPVLSTMILQSPLILTICGFIAGAIMFSGAGQNE